MQEHYFYKVLRNQNAPIDTPSSHLSNPPPKLTNVDKMITDGILVKISVIYQNLIKRCYHPELQIQKKLFSTVVEVPFERWEIKQPNMQIIFVVQWP